ncbi:MAG: Xaa-Pro peptidase family protein [Candidatus Omnitrophota bacterium]
MTSRLSRLRTILKHKGIDAIILTHPANVSYLTQLQTLDSCLFIHKNKCLLITDSRYATEYRNCLNNKEIEILDTGKSLAKTLKEITKKIKISNLGFEQEHTSFYLYQKLKSVFKKKLIPCSKIVEKMRVIKVADEFKLIKQAVNITLDTFKYIKEILRPGLKEIELAAEIERFIRLRGAMNSSFDIIVASGPNSSLPHAQKTDRKIRNNEPVLIDMGVEYKGYKSDLTRVFFLGKMDTLFKKAYSIVQTAQQKARKLIKPGSTIDHIDRSARDFIANNGFEGCFKHSLGHGIGLETHELPNISQKNKKKLKAGMVFTLEPAIYLDNKFGIRIEDMILVTPSGIEVLSDSRN